MEEKYYCPICPLRMGGGTESLLELLTTTQEGSGKDRNLQPADSTLITRPAFLSGSELGKHFEYLLCSKKEMSFHMCTCIF